MQANSDGSASDESKKSGFVFLAPSRRDTKAYHHQPSSSTLRRNSAPGGYASRGTVVDDGIAPQSLHGRIQEENTENNLSNYQVALPELQPDETTTRTSAWRRNSAFVLGQSRTATMERDSYERTIAQHLQQQQKQQQQEGEDQDDDGALFREIPWGATNVNDESPVGSSLNMPRRPSLGRDGLVHTHMDFASCENSDETSVVGDGESHASSISPGELYQQPSSGTLAPPSMVSSGNLAPPSVASSRHLAPPSIASLGNIPAPSMESSENFTAPSVESSGSIAAQSVESSSGSLAAPSMRSLLDMFASSSRELSTVQTSSSRSLEVSTVASSSVGEVVNPYEAMEASGSIEGFDDEFTQGSTITDDQDSSSEVYSSSAPTYTYDSFAESSFGQSFSYETLAEESAAGPARSVAEGTGSLARKSSLGSRAHSSGLESIDEDSTTPSAVSSSSQISFVAPLRMRTRSIGPPGQPYIDAQKFPLPRKAGPSGVSSGKQSFQPHGTLPMSRQMAIVHQPKGTTTTTTISDIPSAQNTFQQRYAVVQSRVTSHLSSSSSSHPFRQDLESVPSKSHRATSLGSSSNSSEGLRQGLRIPMPPVKIPHRLENEHRSRSKASSPYSVGPTRSSKSSDPEGVFFGVSQEDLDGSPKNRPPVLKHRQLTILSALFCFVVASVLGAVAIGIILGNKMIAYEDSESLPPTETASDKPFPTPSPSRSPALSQRDRILRQKIGVAVGKKVNEKDSAYDLAAKWLINEDPLKLSTDAKNLIQRYSFALFYHLTTDNGTRRWRSCNPAQQREGRFCRFERLTKGTGFGDELRSDPIPAFRWLSGEHECNWAGITCESDKSASAIALAGQNITGTLPAELSLVSSLKSITLSHNGFNGTLPAEYTTMRQLISLDLHGNSIHGTIPSEYWMVGSSFQRLDLDANRLEGTICTELGLLTNLKSLSIRRNKLEGQIPSELGKLRYLTYLRLDQNRFHGIVPSELGKMMSLRQLWLFANRMYGTLPSELGLLSELTDLRIFRNRLNGTIPEEIFGLSNLATLELSEMLLSGTLSTRVGQLRKLIELRLRQNSLTGTIPTELAKLDKLQKAELHFNFWEGTVPESICSIFDNGELLDLTADCLPYERPVQTCKCCTGCCNRITGICDIGR